MTRGVISWFAKLLEKQDLPAGVYQAAIWIDGKRIAVGQVVFTQ